MTLAPASTSLAADLQRLTDVHKRMVELRLDGLRATEIATTLGIRRETVGRVLKSPLFQDTLARRRAERESAVDTSHAVGVANARDALNGAAKRAVDKLVGLLDSESEHTALAAAKIVLDKTLSDSKDDTPIVAFTQVNVNMLVDALRESRDAAVGLADVIDADVVEVAEEDQDS
jgi:hypothetical protein